MLGPRAAGDAIRRPSVALSRVSMLLMKTAGQAAETSAFQTQMRSDLR